MVFFGCFLGFYFQQSPDRDLCSITRESANEFCWIFFQDILGVLWLF
ncbi:hypothetical protein [uncultured Gammaproteobacteria bacterium]|nr:hypothetical protein [uncultured Gammaproteobacteria bacterium]